MTALMPSPSPHLCELLETICDLSADLGTGPASVKFEHSKWTVKQQNRLFCWHVPCPTFNRSSEPCFDTPPRTHLVPFDQ